MSERILLSNAKMPGWTTERVDPQGKEQIRVDVYDPAGERVGAVVYLRRKSRSTGNSVYGWRPADRLTARLTDKLEAVQRLAAVPSP